MPPNMPLRGRRVAAPSDWTVVTLLTSVRRATAVADWAAGAAGVAPVTLTKPRDSRAWIDLYFPDSRAAAAFRQAASDAPGVAAVAIRVCRARDWQSVWRSQFPPVTIADCLRIVPTWHARRRTRRGWREIRIDPGLSFGTGRHFTTRFCLERIAAACFGSARPRSMLDVGCGNGVLSLAAARLGVQRVVATDNDAAAVAQARENARRNRLSPRLRIEVSDALQGLPPGPFDLVVANLYGGLLVRLAHPLAAVARRALVVSGLREQEADAVADAFAAEGLEEHVRDGDGEWCGLEFRRPTRSRR